MALEVSEGTATFYANACRSMAQTILENNLDREPVLAAVRSRVSDMVGDSFRLQNCGSELAEMLGPMVGYKIAAQAANERQEPQAPTKPVRTLPNIDVE